MRNTFGTAALIAAAESAAIMFIGMNGDGCQAPGAIVVRKVREPSDLYPEGEYAVHFANTQCGGFHSGTYTKDLGAALVAACEDANRYDPTGRLRANFIAQSVEIEYLQPA